MQVSGIGRVIFWGGGNLWIGRAADPVPMHAHHAIQIAIGFTAPVEFRSSSSAHWTAYPRGALIRPDAPHEFKASGRRVVNVLFEPESELGRALLERYRGGPVTALDAYASDLARAYDAGAPDEMHESGWAMMTRRRLRERERAMATFFRVRVDAGSITPEIPAFD